MAFLGPLRAARTDPRCHRRLGNDAAPCGRTPALPTTRSELHPRHSATEQVPPQPLGARPSATATSVSSAVDTAPSSTTPSHSWGPCGRGPGPGRGARVPAPSSACSSPQPQTAQTPPRAEQQPSVRTHFFRFSKCRPLDRRILTSAGPDSTFLSVKRTDSHVCKHSKAREVSYP